MEIFILISLSVLLLIINIVWVRIRKRKKRFGIFPGIISIVVMAIFGGYAFYLMLSHSHKSFNPKIVVDYKAKAKGDVSASNMYMANYRAERAKYDQKQAHKEYHMSKLDILKDLCGVQSVYAFFFCIWGLFNVGNRDKFYTILGVIHFALAIFFLFTDISSILSLSLA